MTNVVITGSREWPIDKAWIIWEALARIKDEVDNLAVLYSDYWKTTFHHGECPYGGADLIGASWAAGAGWEVLGHPPEQRVGWAYAKRNKEMIDLLPDYVVVCYLEGAGNRGTKMTHEMALARGLEDRIVEVRA
jgi:hypothetical protein